MRAAAWTDSPTYPVSVSDGRPRWSPIRIRTCSPWGQGSASIARCVSIAACTACSASSNTAKTSSPRADTTCPNVARTGLLTRRRTSASTFAYSIAEALEQPRRALDVGQQEGDVARRELALRLELRADEPDRHDPVLLGRPQQPVASLVARGLVLEVDLAEARQGVPHVRLVVDRQAALAARIDVCECAVGKLRTLLGA